MNRAGTKKSNGNKYTKERVKNIVFIFLIIIIMCISITELLKINSSTKIAQIFKDSLTAQAAISEYIGKMKSDTFDIYTTEQLLLGSTDIEGVESTRITDNNDNNILQMVSTQDKITLNNTVFYKLNVDEFEKKFGVKLYEDDGITWYIKNTGDIKLNYINKPNWWTQELDAIHIGD